MKLRKLNYFKNTFLKILYRLKGIFVGRRVWDY